MKLKLLLLIVHHSFCISCFYVFYDLNANGGNGGFNRRNFQDGNKPLAFVIFPLAVTPCVSVLGFGVTV